MATKVYTERYYTLTEDEMQELIARAKVGDGLAQLELLEVFANFLAKYTTLLFQARYSLKDYDVRRFLALFVKDNNARRSLLRNKINGPTRKIVNEAVSGIHIMVQRYCDLEDVEQTVQMTFLQCVDRYKRKGAIPFSGYLYSYYFYLLKKQVDEFMIDQLGRKTFPLLSDEDSYSNEEGEDFQPGYTAPPSPGVEDLLGAEIIDEYWVIGDTAMTPFDVLSQQERQLLRWRYIEGIKSSEIAYRITEHPNTVREHFHRIRKKLQEVLIEDGIELRIR